MEDESKTKRQLINELTQLRQRMAQLEAAETERKRTEEALRQSEARFRELADSLPETTYETDDRGNITFANRAAFQNFGYTREDFEKGLNVSQMVIPEDWDRARASIRRILAGEYVGSAEYTAQKKDGTRFPVIIHSTAIIREGKAVGLRGVITDITEQKRAQEQLRQTLEKVQAVLRATVSALAATTGVRDPFTSSHQRRVAQLSCAIGNEMVLPPTQVEGIRVGATIHDVGKIAVPAEILTRPGKLTDTEMTLVKFHSQVGYDILKTIPFEWPVADMALQHHERMDGSGYPSGLLGRDILLEARIMGVADVVQAMCSHRPYRPALGMEAALEEVSRGRGVLYDVDVVAACERVFAGKESEFEANE